MPIRYIDPVGGSDAADSLTRATALKTITTGATGALLVSGDEVRIMESPAPTSLGIDGTWTSLPQQATQAITSSTNATPIVITRASHGLTTGDTVVITGHTTNTNANGTWEVTVINSSTFSLDTSVGNGVGGATGTFRKINGMIVRLASALTANIASCGNMRTPWTASANVTATLNVSDYKEGYGSDNITITAGFTTGMAAYKATGTIDLSGFQQVSFLIKQFSGTLATAAQLTIRLCSDTAGVTAVDTLNLPAIGALSTWQKVVIDKGSALGSSIQSIALNVNSDLGAQTFQLSNIIACKASSNADAITHKSLISKSDYIPFPIMSINGTRVMLGAHSTILPTSTLLGGYHGTSETVTTYKRETFDMGPFATATTAANVLNDNGIAGSPITFTGGWDSTNMSTQSGETWFSSSNGNGIGLSDSRNFIVIDNLHFDNWSTGHSISSNGTDHTVSNMKMTACLVGTSIGGSSLRGAWSNLTFLMCGSALINAARNSTFDDILVIGGGNTSANSVQQICSGCVTDGLIIRHAGDTALLLGVSQANICQQSLFRNVTITAAALHSITVTLAWKVTLETVTLTGGTSNVSTGININAFCAELRFRDMTTSGHSIGVAFGGIGGELMLLSPSMSEATEFSVSTGGVNFMIYSQNHDGTGETVIRSDSFTGGSTSAIVDGGSGKAWVISPTGTSRDSYYPCTQFLGRILCDAGTLVTVTARMRRSNVALTLSLCCRGGQIAGVPNDVRASASGAAGPFETVTITFTPTEAGFVDIIAEGYGGTTHTGYIDNLTASQA